MLLQLLALRAVHLLPVCPLALAVAVPHSLTACTQIGCTNCPALLAQPHLACCWDGRCYWLPAAASSTACSTADGAGVGGATTNAAGAGGGSSCTAGGSARASGNSSPIPRCGYVATAGVVGAALSRLGWPNGSADDCQQGCPCQRDAVSWIPPSADNAAAAAAAAAACNQSSIMCCTTAPQAASCRASVQGAQAGSGCYE